MSALPWTLNLSMQIQQPAGLQILLDILFEVFAGCIQLYTCWPLYYTDSPEWVHQSQEAPRQTHPNTNL